MRTSKDAGFVAHLEDSLQKAKQAAGPGRGLDPGLFAALEWPTKFNDYVKFLAGFLTLIPQRSSNEVWLQPGTPEYREIYDRLCHFYFLIDQPVGPGGTTLQDIDWFKEFLVSFANAWGKFLDTTDSFDDAMLQSFITDSPWFRVGDSMIGDPPRPNVASGWLTFNQFFAHELNPGLRPIDSPINNNIVVAPADSTYRAKYRIDKDSQLEIGVNVKGTHTIYSIEKLLEGSQYAKSFANGLFVHYFLGPYSYHRFHTPVAGVVKECCPVVGNVYLQVKLNGGQFDAPDATKGGYEFTQARGVVTIDTSKSPYGDVGIIAVVPVGMCQVSSVNMLTVPGTQCEKGEEFGYFLFGGSGIIILYQEREGLQWALDDPPPQYPDSPPKYRHYGTRIATLGNIPAGFDRGRTP